MEDLALSEEQETLGRTVRRFLEAKSPESAVRTLMAGERGFDDAVWRQMADQLGLQGLGIPERYGGSGFGPLELHVVLEEMGRALLCAPYFATVVLAGNALLVSGDEQAKEAFLPAIASGHSIATVALAGPGGQDAESVATTAIRDGSGWRVTGSTLFVLDGHIADLVLVLARTGAGPTLFAIQGDADGMTRTRLSTMDMTRKQARLEFENTPAAPVGTEGDGDRILRTTRDLAAAALAAEQVGGAQQCLDMATEFAKTRVAFGRPIGSFQAVKHKLAEMLVDVESARSVARHAAWCAAFDDEELPASASLAQAYCTAAGTRAAAQNIHIHGGIGFTWEHPAQLYFRRAKSSESLLGGPVHHRELFAHRVGL